MASNLKKGKVMDNLVRHSAPNKYDQAPFGTKCYVYVTDVEREVYIQRSKQENDPNWEYALTEHILDFKKL